MASLNCDICTKTDNHCCKADIPLDIPVALALVEVSGLTNLAITETPKFPITKVLIANRGDVGKLHVSPQGLARIDFTGTDFESSYWLVQLQN